MPGMQGNNLTADQVLAIINGADKGDDGLLVEFNTKEVEDDKLSAEFGYKQFRSEVYVKIAVPGDSLNITHRKATHCDARRGCSYVHSPRDTPCDAHRWPRQYVAFQGDLDQQEASGMPLAAWAVVDKAQVLMLKAQGIHTVEQLAGVIDSSLPQLGPIRKLRQQAQDFISTAKGNAPIERLRAEKEELESKLELLERIVKEQGAKIDQLTNMGGAPAVAEPVAKNGRR